jgi:hypothetical protein
VDWIEIRGAPWDRRSGGGRAEVFDNHGRVRIISVSLFPVSGRRDRVCRVSKTVGEAWGVGWAAVELWEEKVGEYLRSYSGSEEEKARGLELAAEDRERKSSIQVVEEVGRSRRPKFRRE